MPRVLLCALLAVAPCVLVGCPDVGRVDAGDAANLDTPTSPSDGAPPPPDVACAAGMTACSAGSSVACVDMQTDPLNCGACGTACAMGQTCVAGACACGAGRTACSGTCADTMTDPQNCGACGHACAAGQACAAGACSCPAPQQACGGACVNTMVDPQNCGTCGHACAATDSCSAGTCNSLCGRGTTSCGGMCVNPLTDNANCGACNNACGTGRSCVMGVCVPPNDTRATATRLSLSAAETTVMGNTGGATHDGPAVPCACTNGPNVWHQFVLTADEFVYFDTAGSSFDTSLMITDASGNAVDAQSSLGSPQHGLCNDDAGCMSGGFTATLQSRTWGRLGAGTYYVVVGGCGSGAYVLHAQHMSATAGTSFAGYLASGIGAVSGALPIHNTTTGSCGMTSTSTGEDVRLFVTCGGTRQLFSVCMSDGGTYERHQLLTDFDPVLYIRSGVTGGELACNDDGMSMGAIDCRGYGGDSSQYGSRLNDIATDRGMYQVFLDSRTGGDATLADMNYTLRYAVRNAP